MRNSILLLATSVLLHGCTSYSPKEEKLKLYNDILDQVIADNYLNRCISVDKKTEQKYWDYIEGKIDEATYLKIEDSVKSAWRNTHTKCILDYSNELEVYDDDVLTDIGRKLESEPFFKDMDISIFNVLDSISRPANLDAKNLNVSFLQIVPHINATEKLRYYGEGIGVFGFSGICFNNRANKAILYYQLICGGKCGTGEVIFADRTGDKWKINKLIRIGDR